MGYIGNEPTTGHFPVDNFTSSGGSTYTLTRVPASAGAIEVSVQGVLQPTTAYTVSGSTLTMAGVTSGVKIFVRHLGETLSLPTPADGSVTTAKLGTNSVTTGKIAAGAVELADMQSGTAGDTLYYNPAPVRLAKGTAAQVLTMNAGATAPEWAAAAGGGGGLTSKVVAGNYDMSVTGSLAVTGAGFVPTACIVFIHKDSDPAASWGFASSTVTDDGNIHDLHNGGVSDRNSSSGSLWTLQTAAGVNANGVVASYDADGATFTRTKLGSPTGTAYYYILFMK